MVFIYSTLCFSYSKRADATEDLSGAIEVCYFILALRVTYLALFYYRKSVILEAIS